ncbi:Fur family transcriptional regulator [Thermodesulfobacteriota bacterium]
MDQEFSRSRDDQIRLFKKLCRENGVRITPQRLEIFLALLDRHDHPSAEDVFESVKVRLPTISLDTVYRTLGTFESHGLVLKLNLFDDKTRYDPNMHQHHHVVCTRCRNIMDFDWPDFDEAMLPSGTRRWGNVEIRQVQLRGICSDCLADG